MKYVVLPEDWQTESEIKHFSTEAAAVNSAHHLADYYHIDVEILAITGEDVIKHIEIKPATSKAQGNYYWDIQGKYQFANIMED